MPRVWVSHVRIQSDSDGEGVHRVQGMPDLREGSGAEKSGFREPSTGMSPSLLNIEFLK